MDKNSLILKGVRDGAFPRALFKYMSLNDNTKKSLSNMEFWFARPESFNDPFDCSLSFKASLSSTDYRNYLRKLGMPNEYIKEQILIAKKNPSFLKQDLEKIFNTVLNRRGVLSLSKQKDNLLMWAHYCRDHTGLVVEFDVEKDPTFFQLPVNVKYVKSYSPLDFYKDPNEAITKTIQTKSSEWEYEQEVRIIKQNFGLHSISPDAVKNIYFGCRVGPVDINDVRKSLSNAGVNGVGLYQAVKSHGKFKIHFTKIESVLPRLNPSSNKSRHSDAQKCAGAL